MGSTQLSKIEKIVRESRHPKDVVIAEDNGHAILTADNVTLDGRFEIVKTIFLDKKFIISDEKIK